MASTDQLTPSEPPPPPLVIFAARFKNGRTAYHQPLWAGTTWREMQSELNRAVRQKKALWWFEVQGLLLDPEAIVPLASSDGEYVLGDLIRLPEPLDFDALRSLGRLCAPAGPTHITIENELTPVDRPASNLSELPPGAHALPQTEEQVLESHGSLVDSVYESSAESVLEHATVADSAVMSVESVPSSSPASVHSIPGSSICSAYIDGIWTPRTLDVDTTPEIYVEDELHRSASSEDIVLLELCRQGGAKSQRVQHTSIVKASYDKLLGDLKLTSFGMVIEHQCVLHTLKNDARASRA
eukprot:369177-Amphidinium_carterae.1